MKKFTLILFILGLTSCINTNQTSQYLPESQVTSEQALQPEINNLGLTESDIDTLLSLRQIDDYPLYTMNYFTSYEDFSLLVPSSYRNLSPQSTDISWSCSLFASFADPKNRLYGRNFDWEFSPALLLYTYPKDGFASASMVDIAYLGFTGDLSMNLTEKPFDELRDLLSAPYFPFDGVNEAGLAIGMAAVSPGDVPLDPELDTLGSLEIIRVVLDHAANVEEGLEIIQRYNIDFAGGPPIHYLMADALGNSVLFEYYQGEKYIYRNQTPWQHATNFLNASVKTPSGQCWRYDVMSERLQASQGRMSPETAMNLLKDVSQNNTQWSVVYDLSRHEIRVVMGKRYSNEYVLPLELKNP